MSNVIDSETLELIQNIAIQNSQILQNQDEHSKELKEINEKVSLLATNHLLEWLEELKGYAKALADRYNALDMLPDANYDELLKLEAELGVSDIDEIQVQIKVYKESMNSLVNAISKSDAKILASDMFASSNDNTQSEKIVQMLDELKSRVDEVDGKVSEIYEGTESAIRGINKLGKNIDVADDNIRVVNGSVKNAYHSIVSFLDNIHNDISRANNTLSHTNDSVRTLQSTVDRLPKESAISRY